MRRLISIFIAAAAMLSSTAVAWADGRCDLNTLVGYVLAYARPIDGYIENGIRHSGYEGCQPDRVLVFSDNNGVRCMQSIRQRTGALPTGYLFARDNYADLKLCVEGELFDVMKTN